jgi:hypothetical protein
VGNLLSQHPHPLNGEAHPLAMLGKQEAAKKICRVVYAKDLVGVFLRNQVTKTFGIPFVAKWIMGSTLLDHLELPDY